MGIGLNPSENFSFTVDYYNIRVKDRIVLSNEITPSGVATNTLDQILSENGIVSVSFFTNSLNTVTSGLDVVANYRRLSLGSGQLSFNLAANYTMQNERDGAVISPPIIENAGQSVIDPTQEALIFTSRPKYKAILGIDYTLNKFGFALNNTVFGPTEFRNAGMSSDLKIEFATKVVTDLAVTFQATDNVMLGLNINNLFNVLPEWSFKALNSDGQALLNDNSTNDANYPGLTPAEIQSNLITFNQRYSTMTYDGYHFSQLGTIINFTASLKF
jgi:iron complex outermembrane recepter protein